MSKRPTSNNLADSPPLTQNRCGLLVSVRDAAEARLALKHKIDVLDLKEPLNGALGPVSETVIAQAQQLAAAVPPDRRPKLSFALGELADWDFERWPNLLARYPGEQITGFSFVKIGLAGDPEEADWQFRWRQLFAELPETIQPVVVGYLDRLPELQNSISGESANTCCPSIEQLVDFAQSQAQVSTILLDTCDKQNDLFASVDDRRLKEIIAAADRAGLSTVVAGSVRTESLQRVIHAGANLVGVRGAVCDGDRSGQLCEQKLKAFSQNVAGSSSPFAPRK